MEQTQIRSEAVPELPSDADQYTAFVFARPRYVAYAQYKPYDTQFEWTILPIPSGLSGSNFGTGPLVQLMRTLLKHFQCKAESHQVAPQVLAEGVPMGLIQPSAISHYVEIDASTRLVQGWGADVSSEEVDHLHSKFYEALAKCVVDVPEVLNEEHPD